MLPTPASHRIPGKPRIFFPSSRDGSYSTHASQQWLTLLRGRSRLTNLAVSLMCSLLAVSLLLNLYMFPLSGADTSSRSRWRPFTLRPSMRGWDDNATPLQLDSGIPLSIETTVDRDHRFGELEHLIMVPGHAIWLGHDASKVEEDDQWILEPMQKGGSVKTYVKHIREGVERLRQDPKALLVFSGGATRAPPSPPIPEALSYLSLAQALTILPPQTSGDNSPKGPLPLSLRATTEEFALDSYENLLFAVARFKEVTGRWPGKITVVGYGMKRRRFEHLHRAAIGYPLEQFEYVGIDDEGDTMEHYAGELKYGYTPFLSSPSGCHPPLSIKRQIRNPYSKYHPYHSSCPELVDLFEWCPPAPSIQPAEDGSDIQVFGGEVPWSVKGKGKTRWGKWED